MWDFLKKRPMLLSAVFACVISVIAMYAEMALFVICLIILSGIFVMVYKNTDGEIIFAAICILAVSVSAFVTTAKIDNTKDYDRVNCNGEFIVIEEPVDHGEYHSVTIETVSSDVLNSGDKLSVVYYDGVLEFPQRIKASISVSSLSDYRFKNQYYSDKIFLNGYIKEFFDTGEEDEVLAFVDSVRKYIKLKIFDYYDYTQAATMLALVTGDRDYFTDSFYGNVKSAGVAHVMVVSGMHLSVMVALFLFLSDKFFRNRYLKAITIFIVTVVLTAICGFTMSILRAGITYLLLAVSLIINRESTPENTLGCAVTVILFSNPFAIFNIAFELSVLSTFAILVVALPVTDYVSQKGIIKSKVLLSLFSAVMISLSALVFTSPVTVYFFGYISNVSVVTNLLIGTSTSVAMVLCVLGFLFPFLENLLFGFGEIIVTYINYVINFFGSLPFATTELPQYTAYIFWAVIIIVIWILLACKKHKSMLKLKEIREKKLRERSKKVKWQ